MRVQNTFIFLDIDGVLNSSPYMDRVRHEKGFCEINEDNVRILSELYHRYNAKIVLSSTWRELSERHPMYIYLEECLRKYNMHIYAKTPYVHEDRPLEIVTWLRIHAHKGDKIIVLDDDFSKADYLRYSLDKCVIHTLFYCDTEKEGGLQHFYFEKLELEEY